MLLGPRIVWGVLAAFLALGCAWAYQAVAVGPKETPADKKPVGGIQPEQFDKLHALIKPKPGGFDEVRWLTSLWEARKKAAAEGKPILIWVGDGHPLGFT
jgi:hypothetical protein